MKNAIGILFLLSFLPWSGWSQEVGVNVKGIDGREDTTIRIEKGEKNKLNRQWEINEGREDIEGDASPLLQDARKNWKRACEDWKKEFKDLNKENQILSMGCGSMKCTTAAMESTCKSEAKYKIKTLIN